MVNPDNKVTKERIEILVKMVFANYPSYANKNEFGIVCKLYYLMLENEDYNQILENLKTYIAANDRYAPKPKDLLNSVKGEKLNIPNVQETREYLDSLEPKDKPTKEEILAMARKAGLRV